jgi:hypothetical protein
MASTRGSHAIKGNLAVSGNATFEKGARIPYLEIVDRKSRFSSGGTFLANAWRERDLTDVNFNEVGAVVDLAASAGDGGTITLTRGVYYCEIECPAFSVNEHVARLADITVNPGDGADVLVIGTSEFALDESPARAQTRSKISGRFQITGTRVLSIQHRCSSTQAVDGFGSAAEFYLTDNIYTLAKFWKIRDDS